MSRRTRFVVAALSVGSLAAGCAASGGDDEARLATWCDAVEDMYEAGSDLDSDPADVDPAVYEAWVERGEALFATPAPEGVRHELELLQDPDAEAGPDEINAASQHVTDFIEENCAGLDPSFFEPAA